MSDGISSPADEVAPKDRGARLGLIFGVPEAEYHSGPGLSVSALKRFAELPEKARVQRPETRSLAFGTLIHTAIMEPDQLGARYWVVDLERISERDRATQEAMKLAGGRELVKRKEWDEALRIRDRIHSHPTLREMLAPVGLRTEASFWWIDDATGLLCRGRADGLREDWGVVLDLKSTTDASPDGFSRSVAEYRYHWQQAHYETGLAATWREPRAFFFIAVEKVEPYSVAIYELDPRAVDLGRREVREQMVAWAECKRTGIWPGFPVEPQPLDLPAWAYAKAGAYQ